MTSLVLILMASEPFLSRSNSWRTMFQHVRRGWCTCERDSDIDPSVSCPLFDMFQGRDQHSGITFVREYRVGRYIIALMGANVGLASFSCLRFWSSSSFT